MFQRFGKERMKEESKEVFLKATTPRRPKRAQSAIERPFSSRVKVTGSRSGGNQRLNNSLQTTPRVDIEVRI